MKTIAISPKEKSVETPQREITPTSKPIRQEFRWQQYLKNEEKHHLGLALFNK